MRATSETCLVCGSVNPPERTTCSKACRYELVARRHRENGTRPPELTEAQRAERAERVRGSNAPWWKGGRALTDSGYVTVVAPADYPFPQSVRHNNRIREHRMVMELHLGRALDPREVVHHINGDRTDNRIENLELHTSHSEHMGEHAEDSARRMVVNSALTRAVPATCRTCGAEYRTNARSTGECAPCRTKGYEAKRRGQRRAS
jgi:predicted Zn-ribbon and HTH transcriptional regulator